MAPPAGRPRDLFLRSARALARYRREILTLLPNGPTFTGPQLLDRIESFASHLARRGVGPRDRLLISASHPLSSLVALSASWSLDAVPILCGGGLPRIALEARRRDFAPDFILADGGPGSGETVPGADSGPSLRKGRRRGTRRLPLPGGTVLVRTTSGTAGPARGVALSAVQLLADAGNILASVRPPTGAHSLGAVPLDHAYGFSTLLTPLLFHSRPLVLLEKPLPALFREALARYPRLFFPGVPVLYELLLDSSLSPVRLRRLACCLSAGAPLPESTATRFHRRCGRSIRNLYGASECGAVACDRTPRGRFSRRGVGTPLRGVRLMIEGPAAGRRSSRRGRIGVAGAAVALGYVRSGQPPERFGGRFWTSDFGRIEAGRRLFLEGRLDSMINVGGLKVHPVEVERVLLRAPGVREAVAIGMPDPRRGEVVAAVIAGAAGLRREALAAFCGRRLPDHSVPRQLLILRVLPRTDRGKIDTARVRSLLASGGGHRPDGGASPRR